MVVGRLHCFALGLFAFLGLTLVAAAAAQSEDAMNRARQLVVTVDDLPGVSTSSDLSVHEAITQGVLEALRGVPAIGFVNESKLFEADSIEPRAARVALLEQWLEAGHELGNHTFSHPDLHRTSLPDFKQNILDGERITRNLAQAAGRPLRYFRHPFLHTGTDLATKADLQAFLSQHGYAVAPVTIDNSEWIFARAYDRALDQRNDSLAMQIRTSYLEYMTDVVTYYEQQSRAILGYELPQILLIHANRLNADALASLLERLATRKYRFVSLEQALVDPAYRRADTYVGPAGITWLHRWALADGKRGEFFAGEPTVPPFVQQASGLQ